MRGLGRLTRFARAATRLPAWAVVKGHARDIATGTAVVPYDEAQMRRGFWPKIRRNIGRLPFAQDLVAAWYAMLDPATPHTPRAILIGALAYFVMPADIVPDILVGTGFLDDATVLGFALQSVQRHILPAHHEQARQALELQVPEQVPEPGSGEAA